VRRAQSYGVAPPRNIARPATPTEAANVFPRSHFGNGSLVGLRTLGSLAMWVPINRPAPATTPTAFPLAVPSRAAPNAIRIAVVVAQNFYSPSAHQTRQEPQVVPNPALTPKSGHMRSYGAQPPRNWRMPAKALHGTGGKFTIPSPATTPYWPTSAEWLTAKLARFR